MQDVTRGRSVAAAAEGLAILPQDHSTRMHTVVILERKSTQTTLRHGNTAKTARLTSGRPLSKEEHEKKIL